VNRQNTELIVIVTPELVRPIPAGGAVPELKYPMPFLESSILNPVKTPGMAATGPVPVTPPETSIPFEKLIQSMQPEKQLNVNSTSSVTANAPSSQQQDTTFTPPSQTPPQR
jgi:pilus assembly protein CpaC